MKRKPAFFCKNDDFLNDRVLSVKHRIWRARQNERKSKLTPAEWPANWKDKHSSVLARKWWTIPLGLISWTEHFELKVNEDINVYNLGIDFYWVLLLLKNKLKQAEERRVIFWILIKISSLYCIWSIAYFETTLPHL